MRTPEQVIAQTIRFDNRPTANAKRILMALRDEGYEVAPRQQVLRPMGDSATQYGQRARRELLGL